MSLLKFKYKFLMFILRYWHKYTFASTFDKFILLQSMKMIEMSLKKAKFLDCYVILNSACCILLKVLIRYIENIAEFNLADGGRLRGPPKIFIR
jgi:hypothetical protein